MKILAGLLPIRIPPPAESLIFLNSKNTFAPLKLLKPFFRNSFIGKTFRLGSCGPQRTSACLVPSLPMLCGSPGDPWCKPKIAKRLKAIREAAKAEKRWTGRSSFIHQEIRATILLTTFYAMKYISAFNYKEEKCHSVQKNLCSIFAKKNYAL